MNQIFIVEDNKTEGLVIKLSFEGIENINVSYFPTGGALIDSLDTLPEVIILDLHLPDIYGLDLIPKITKMSPQTRIIVISAQEDTDIIAKTQKLGVSNYVVKSEYCLKYLRESVLDLIKIIDFDEKRLEKQKEVK